MRRQYYNFNRLVSKYSSDIRIHVQKKGYYQGGIYHEGETEIVESKGACIAMKRSAMNNSGGNYSGEEKRLYMLSPIPHALENVKIEIGGQLYKASTDRDHGNEIFTGVYAYYLTWTEPFDRRKESGNADRYGD